MSRNIGGTEAMTTTDWMDVTLDQLDHLDILVNFVAFTKISDTEKQIKRLR